MQTDWLKTQVIPYKNKYIKFHNFADEYGVSSSIDTFYNNKQYIWQLHIPHFQYMVWLKK